MLQPASRQTFTYSATILLVLILLPGIASAQKLDGDELLAPDHVVDVQITLSAADWDTLRGQARNMGAMFSGATMERPFTYFMADVIIDGVQIRSVGVRKKGLFGSIDSQRPSLKIKFDEYKKQDPIRGLNRLTLNNNKQDTSQVSQLLTYRLFREAGIHAPRSNFAQVSVNGQPLGIYSNIESVKSPFLQRSFGNSSGNLYEGTLTDFYPKTVEKLEAKTNKKNNDRSRITRLAELLAADGDLALADVEQIVDLDNFLKFWALEGALRFWDGYASNQNNFFFYENPDNDRGYFIPWGADSSFSGDGGPFARFGSQGPTSLYAQSMLANRLYRTPGFPERYRQTMLKLLDEVWKEDELVAEIDRVEKLIEPHLHESQRGAPRAMNDVREFIRSRRDVIRKELSDGPVDVPPEPRKPMYAVTVGEMNGSFTAEWQDTPPVDPTVAGNTDVTLMLNGKAVAVTQMGVIGQTFRIPRFGPGGRGPGGNAPPPASLVFTGTRSGDGQRITISLFCDRAAFGNEKQAPIEVTGMLTEGENSGFGFGGPGRKSVNGQLRLSKSGTNQGDAIVGSVDLKIVEVRGGMFNRPPPRPANRQRPSFVRPPGIPGLQRILDTNGDGELSASEINAATESLRKLDLNDDGRLSQQELATPRMNRE